VRQTLSALVVAWVALMWMSGCATSGAAGRPSAFRDEALPPEFAQGSDSLGFWEKRDDFQFLQESAGLEESSWHEVGEELETGDAHKLWEALAHTRTTLQSFGPRRSLIHLLRQALTQNEDVAYTELLQRIRPFHFLVVMRPDGYLVSALTGKPLQRMGRVELRDGKLMAGVFEVGAFYRDRGGIFYPVDDLLRPSGPLLGELGLERDWFNAALDGSEDALGETGLALAQLVTSPVRSVQGLQQLPSAVAALIASSLITSRATPRFRCRSRSARRPGCPRTCSCSTAVRPVQPRASPRRARGCRCCHSPPREPWRSSR